MRSSHSLDTAFDNDRLAADAGLLLPATLAAHLGLKEIVETHLDLGQAAGRANVRNKCSSRSSCRRSRGGDCIDNVAALATKCRRYLHERIVVTRHATQRFELLDVQDTYVASGRAAL